MIIGINMRIKVLNYNKKFRDILFKSDFFYGLIIASIVPILGYLNFLELIKYSYLISSLITIIFYFIIKKKLNI